MRGKRGRGGKQDVWDVPGGYMGVKKAKLVDQFTEQAKIEETKDGIFEGIAIFVNGWTNPTADELKRIMMEHGGTFHHYYNSRQTTHIIASNLPDVKIRQLKGHELIIKPEWISECLAQGRLVDYKPFLLFTHQTRHQPAINTFLPLTRNTAREEEVQEQKVEEVERDEQDEQEIEKNHVEEEEDGDVIMDVRGEPSSAPAHNQDGESHEESKSRQRDEVGLSNKGEDDCGNAGQDGLPNKRDDHGGKGSHQGPGGSPFKAKDATDPNFLGEFFQNSRLHHISSMGARAKEYVAELRRKSDGFFPAREKLRHLYNTDPKPQQKTIMHIDMDSFFVSVGLRSRPDLVGQPVAVTHSRGNKKSRGAEQDELERERRQQELLQYRHKLEKRAVGTVNGVEEDRPVASHWKLDNVDGVSSMSEIASCSYEARAAGIKNGMFLGPALKLCPNLKTIDYDFPGYEEVSRILYDTVTSYTLEVQAVSCDEMFVDLTDLLGPMSIDALRFVSALRSEIQTKTGCCCSVGLGPNIFLARMATKKAKPNGQYSLDSGTAQALLHDLPVGQLPGVGRSLERKLSQLSVATCGDLQLLRLGQLQAQLGAKTGKQLFNFCRGVDTRPLELEQVRKTVSAEVNYGIRFSGWSEAQQFLLQLAGEVCERMEKLATKAKSITLKLMARAKDAPEQTAKFLGHGVCDNLSRSAQFTHPTADKDTVYTKALEMLKAMEIEPSNMRGVGISMSKLEEKNGRDGSNPSGVNNSIVSFFKKSTNSKPLEKEIKSGVSSSATVCCGIVTGDEKLEGYRPGGEIDPAVLAELPEDIRQEVLAGLSNTKPGFQATCHSPAAHPRVSPASSPYSGHHHSSGQFHTPPHPSTSAQATKPPTRITGESHSLLLDLSFSQVDRHVFSELPDDLQSELKGHFQKVKEESQVEESESGEKMKPTAFDTLMFNAISPQKATISPVKGRPRRGRPPGKASTSASATASKGHGQKPSGSSLILDLSFSQVDRHVFSELPDDLQSELKGHFQKVKEESQVEESESDEKIKPTAFDTLMFNAINPLKATISPVKGRPKRGRPPGKTSTSASATAFKGSGQKSSGSRTAETVAPPSIEDLSSDSCSRDSCDANPPPTFDTITTTSSSCSQLSVDEPQQQKPTFCGKSSLEEIRPLIKEWLRSTPNPLREDIEKMTVFLTGLISFWRLDLVSVLLKCIFRNISKLENPGCWKVSWKVLLSTVQAKIVQKYGIPLRVPYGFEK